MTDRVHSLTVVLEENTRVDDVEPLIIAIKMMKGVISVTGNVADIESHIAEERARQKLGSKILEVIYPTLKEGK